MSEKCEHTQVFCSCKTIKGKVFQEGYDSGFQAGKKKERECISCKKLVETELCNSCHTCYVRKETFDEAIKCLPLIKSRRLGYTPCKCEHCKHIRKKLKEKMENKN